MNLFILPSTHLHSELGCVYLLAPPDLADPELLISQSIHQEYMANPAYSWADLAKRLASVGFSVPDNIFVSEKYWDAPQTKVDDNFFVLFPEDAGHEYAGKRMDVLTNTAFEMGEAVLCDAKSQLLYATDLVRKLKPGHQIGDVFEQVPLGKLKLPLDQFANDKAAAARARQMLEAANFEVA